MPHHKIISVLQNVTQDLALVQTFGMKFWLENLKGRQLGKPKHRWEDNTKIDLKEIGWEWAHFRTGASGVLL
jgi:hypothetical protein